VAFSLPDFNLLCDVYSGPFVTKVLRLADVPCNLALGRRVQQQTQDYGAGLFGGANPCLLLPPLTDVRDASQGIPDQDLVEVPKGSGRWYGVNVVDDVAKGFSNEYRIAALYKAFGALDPAKFGTLLWPTPMT